MAAAQRPSCPGCGRHVFVLPLNVYPVVVRTARKPAPPPAKTDEAPKRSPSSRHRAADEQAHKEPRPSGILLESQSRLLTPFRMIVIAIALIAISTGWGLWWRHSVESAKAQVQAASEAGMKALKDGDFGVAARQLTRARDAVDLLRRTDADANAIRRSCREAVAGNELSSSSLIEMLVEYVEESKAKAKKASLGNRHRGAWTIVDSLVTNPGDSGPCLLDMPIAIDGIPFRVEIDSAAIRNAAQREQANGLARVIFAATLSEIRPETDEDSGPTLVLNGKSAFLWTTLETYQQLGYTEDDVERLQETRNLLTRQLEQSETSK